MTGIDDAVRRGTDLTMVCADGHDYWHADDVRQRAHAVSLCLNCPARAACTLDREAALDNGVRLFGVWAGKDYGMAKGHARVVAS